MLGSQIPVVGVAVAWWFGVFKNPIVAAVIAVLYELLVFVWGFLGKEWEALEPDVVKASTDWIKMTVFNGLSGFRRRYKRHVVYEHRVFGLGDYERRAKGLSNWSRCSSNCRLPPVMRCKSARIHWYSIHCLAASRYGRFCAVSGNSATVLAVLGPPGCGKTTLLKHLVLTFALNQQRSTGCAPLSVLLFLRDHAEVIVEQSPSLADSRPIFSDQKRYPELIRHPTGFLANSKPAAVWCCWTGWMKCAKTGGRRFQSGSTAKSVNIQAAALS